MQELKLPEAHILTLARYSRLSWTWANKKGSHTVKSKRRYFLLGGKYEYVDHVQIDKMVKEGLLEFWHPWSGDIEKQWIRPTPAGSDRYWEYFTGKEAEAHILIMQRTR